jgi:hypothetical protein
MEKEVILFRIDAFTPATLPMARLAEYLAQLATLYGARDSVHFDKLLKGSAVVQAHIDAPESHRVITRVKSANTDAAPEDAKRAFQRIDAMLRENRAVGEIKRKSGGKILVFPGRKLPDVLPVRVMDYASVDGIIVRVGGTDNTIPVHLQAPDGQTFPCQVRDKAMARELAAFIFGEPVRVRGQGTWLRSPQGEWKLESMTIDAWESLDPTSMLDIWRQLRAIPGNGWKDIPDIAGELHRIREGD